MTLLLCIKLDINQQHKEILRLSLESDVKSFFQ